MDFLICSQAEARSPRLKESITGPYGWISIWNGGVNKPLLYQDSRLKGILRIEFGDYASDKDPTIAAEGGVVFSHREAEKIKQFVDYLVALEVRMICVHCEAGRSRSATVAAVLSEWLNGSDEGIRGDPKFSINVHISSILKKHLGLIPRYDSTNGDGT